jgi:3,4-dihydroxy 2-butanone 4-phosphate synthase/GTP cyclohydrolase II
VQLALVKGTISREVPTLVRVHVHQSALDLFADVQRAGHWTFRAALRRVAAEQSGVVVILYYPESPENLLDRVRHFAETSEILELPVKKRHREELRTYGLGSQILVDLGVGKMRVLGHAMKLPGMSGFDLEVVEYVEHEDRRGKGSEPKTKIG